MSTALPGLDGDGRWDIPVLLNMARQCLGQPRDALAVIDLTGNARSDVTFGELTKMVDDLARSLTPDVAVFTNLSPDHLDRHAGMGGYFAAKRRLFAEGGPDRAIIGVDEDEGLYLAGQLSEAASDDRVIRISASQKLTGPGWQVFARKGFLSEYRKGRQVASIDLRAMQGLPGAHNHQNACAAYAACRAIGIAPRDIEAACMSFLSAMLMAVTSLSSTSL